MAHRVITEIKRGTLSGKVIEESPNKFFCIVFRGEKEVRKSKQPYFDQDEAEVELGSMIDEVWRESSGLKDKLVRRM